MIRRSASKLSFLLLGIVASGAASADVMISSIDMEVRNSAYAVTSSDTSASAYAQFAAGSLVCDVALASANGVGSSQTCGGPNTNIATLMSVTFSSTASSIWQFGADWGRGGIIYTGSPSGDGSGSPLVGNFWWNNNWNNAFSVSVGSVSNLTLNFLGFEDFAGGAMSMRYSNDGGQTWSIAAVNAKPVPEPGTLFLLGLGFLGLGAARRGYNRC